MRYTQSRLSIQSISPFSQPLNRLLQRVNGLGFQDTPGVSLFRKLQPLLKINLPVTECQMILRRLFTPVMDMEMNQPVLMLHKKGHIRFAGSP